MEADLKQTLLPLINTYLTEKLTMDELDCSLSERGLDSLAFIEIIRGFGKRIFIYLAVGATVYDRVGYTSFLLACDKCLL